MPYHRLRFVVVLAACLLGCASADGAMKKKEELPRKNVLVLGSTGLIGDSLVKALRAAGHNVFATDVHPPLTPRSGYKTLDLRTPGALDAFNDDKIDFVYFLACDVGGSKYIDKSAGKLQQRLLQNNVELYRGVLPWLEEKQIPFVFTSSYLEGEPMPYGAVKRLGEMWIKQMALGRTVRLWNVWGFQPYGLRSHVMNDWVHSCLKKGKIAPITDGLERRQFLHVNDTSVGLVTMMDHFSSLPEVTDMSTGQWLTLRQLSEDVLHVAKQRGLKCTIAWPDAPAKKRTQPEPDQTTPFHKLWGGAKVLLQEGIDELFQMHAETDGASHAGGGGMCGVNQKCM